MPSRLAIGNWKMNTTREEAVSLAAAVEAGLELPDGWNPDTLGVGLAPPFVFLDAVREVIAGKPLLLVAQDCHPEPKGAYTGAVSAPMLASMGVHKVIVGHSERRNVFGDDDATVRAKLEAVLAEGMDPVLCVGERLPQREEGQHRQVVEGQLRAAVEGLALDAFERLTVAYEPVWAIGTGRTATPEQAGEMHTFAREVLSGLSTKGSNVPILYGGSVKPANVEALASTPGVDGVLVGGASLAADSFLSIVRGCARHAPD